MECCQEQYIVICTLRILEDQVPNLESTAVLSHWHQRRGRECRATYVSSTVKGECFPSKHHLGPKAFQYPRRGYKKNTVRCGVFGRDIVSAATKLHHPLFGWVTPTFHSFGKGVVKPLMNVSGFLTYFWYIVLTCHISLDGDSCTCSHHLVLKRTVPLHCHTRIQILLWMTISEIPFYHARFSLELCVLFHLMSRIEYFTIWANQKNLMKSLFFVGVFTYPFIATHLYHHMLPHVFYVFHTILQGKWSRKLAGERDIPYMLSLN